MAGIEEAQNRWQVIRSKGRIRGIVAIVVVVAVVVAIGVLAQQNAAAVAIVVVVGVIVLAVILALIGKQRTGLSLTPEWKPEVDDEDYDDFDDAAAEGRDGAGDPSPNGDEDREADETEPVRRLDAQILGADLAKLGQVVTPKLAKSYAVGTLVLEGNAVVWEPGASSRAAGIESLTAAPNQVASIEAAPLWGSWGLVRLATAGGDEWCMRVPGSVDLSPAFADLGLSVRKAS